MSGHSKWSTIKRKKAATDAKRGKVFTKLLREIQVAAKLGGANAEGNTRLKKAILAAKTMSVPADNIDRAVKRGTGDLEGVIYEEVTYEGYGPGGVAILVKGLSDNKNRTAADVRFAFTRGGGNLGSTNSVAYIFQDRGVFSVAKDVVKEDELFQVALENGAEDIRDTGSEWEVICDPHAFNTLRQNLERLSDKFQGELKTIPNTTVNVSGEQAQALLKLLNSLDELDDVQDVTANFEMADEEMEAFEG